MLRIPLADLVTEYMLHVNRKHLFVEGREDCAVLEWYLEPVSSISVSVFEIDTVEITADELHRHNLTEGKKNRVLVLARELDKALPEGSAQVLCIVDADFDYILNRIERNRFLAYTDGTSLEMYAFSEAALKRVLRLGFRDSTSDPKEILDTLYGILQDVFVTRAVNEALQLGLTWLPFVRRCKIQDDGKIAFDLDKFVRDYLLKNNAHAQTEEFSICRMNLLNSQLGSRWRWVRGHDYAKLLTRYFNAISKTAEARALARSGSVMRMAFVALDRDEMNAAPLFRKIQDFLA